MEVRELVGSSSSWCPNVSVPIFQSDFWCSIYSSGLKRMGVFKGNEIIGLFALFAYQKLGKGVLITPPMTPHFGLHLLTEHTGSFKNQSQNKRVLRAIAEYLEREYPKDYIDLALPPEFKDIMPFGELGFNIEVSYTYLLKLHDRSESDFLGQMSPERRKNIRDAERDGFAVSKQSNVEEGLALIESNLKNQGVAAHSAEMRKLLETRSDNCLMLNVKSAKSEVEATALIGLDSTKAYYLAGGTSKSNSLAGSLALWEALKHAKSRGIGQFDFMGSSVPSIERYFRGFGGELTPYFRVRKNTAVLDVLKSAKQRFKL